MLGFLVGQHSYNKGGSRAQGPLSDCGGDEGGRVRSEVRKFPLSFSFPSRSTTEDCACALDSCNAALCCSDISLTVSFTSIAIRCSCTVASRVLSIKIERESGIPFKKKNPSRLYNRPEFEPQRYWQAIQDETNILVSAATGA
ncbi:unnamed protein product, partial [Timema podura]|nr:unnamed protein product [Timema podura]